MAIVQYLCTPYIIPGILDYPRLSSLVYTLVPIQFSLYICLVYRYRFLCTYQIAAVRVSAVDCYCCSRERCRHNYRQKSSFFCEALGKIPTARTHSSVDSLCSD